MPVDYAAIAADTARVERAAANSLRTLSSLYSERAHFVLELLQNAEDAIRRRGTDWSGSREVAFHLSSDRLRVSHFGEPFNETDVLAICGVGETTKGHTDIGRFGIGFKSVYRFTDRPSIHSGSEDFAIQDCLRPIADQPVQREQDETVILLPFNGCDPSPHDEIGRALGGLGASTLLFLRQIEAIRWKIEGGAAGIYLRQSKELDSSVRRVTVIGEQEEAAQTDQDWLIFSREIPRSDGSTGAVELGFSIVGDKESGTDRIQAVQASPLAVFFPTVVETHLGFLVQGPYRTTPSRETVPLDDIWNKKLVHETATLLRDALFWLRDNGLLDAEVLSCLPIYTKNLSSEYVFSALSRATRSALATEELLPRSDGGYIRAANGRLAETHSLRELFSARQLASLYGKKGELAWLDQNISHGGRYELRELRHYVKRTLGVDELNTEALISKFDERFLEAQSDTWVRELYEFLNGQSSLRQRIAELPLVRLEDGTHVSAQAEGQPKAFLPGEAATGFPTVRATVCSSEGSLEFLGTLGLSPPDPIDDVVRNLLPSYGDASSATDLTEYESDLRRILDAFRTDSQTQKKKLVDALRGTAFVVAIDCGDGSRHVAKPGDVYLATRRLKELFSGVKGVLRVDDSLSSLRGERIRDLLETCGASAHLRTVPVDCRLTEEEKKELRIKAGRVDSTAELQLDDYTLHGLDGVLALLPTLGPDEQVKRATLLWEALVDLANRRGAAAFSGEYVWMYGGKRNEMRFDAHFVARLNEERWVPDEHVGLNVPRAVQFETLDWGLNPYLQSRILFEPPFIEQLAELKGFERGALNQLLKYGLTTESRLQPLIEVFLKLREDDAALADATAHKTLEAETAESESGDISEPTFRAAYSERKHATLPAEGPLSEASSSANAAAHRGIAPAGSDFSASIESTSSTPGKHPTSSGNRSHFISYVGVHSEEQLPDRDGLEHAARMNLEAQAISAILEQESYWRRTPPNNRGFDLYVASDDGELTRLCEVKAMTGSLNDHPVGISRTQFECAREYRDAYWLYIVERAGTEDARIVKIRDPAGKAETFTFDSGWRGVAEEE